LKIRESQEKSRIIPNEWQGGWVRASDIFNEIQNQNARTVTRLLIDLSQKKIIERKECQRIKGHRGKPPVFYRVPDYYDPLLFLTREELLQRIQEYHKWLSQSLDREQACKHLFTQHTGKDPQPLIKEVLETMKKEKEERFKEISEKIVNVIDPCKSL